MKVLVLNCGSSSVKYQLIDMNTRDWEAKGTVSRIGMSGAMVDQKRSDGDEVTVSGDILDHIMAIEYVVSMLMSENHGVIKDKSDIDAVGHRVVHGGENFTESCLVDPRIMQELRKLIELAPLHNPHNLSGIRAAQSILPDVPNVAVFDTAYHHQMPDYAFIYGLPYQLYRKYKIRRYGFHGMSHAYVARRLAEMMERGLREMRVITCHLGNGASLAAIKHSVSVDTSMGFTPLEGLMMGTRSGDLDPAVILHLMGREELSLHEANTLLNKHSGLLGISGTSADMREIIEEMNDGSYSAKLAFNVYCYRVKKYIGNYAAAMGGLDAVAFTAGIGENSPEVRQAALSDLEFLGIKLDEAKNEEARGKEAIISTDDSPVTVAAIPTNEELVIAIDTAELVAAKVN
jgi:acetate kinase